MKVEIEHTSGIEIIRYGVQDISQISDDESHPRVRLFYPNSDESGYPGSVTINGEIIAACDDDSISDIEIDELRDRLDDPESFIDVDVGPNYDETFGVEFITEMKYQLGSAMDPNTSLYQNPEFDYRIIISHLFEGVYWDGSVNQFVCYDDSNEESVSVINAFSGEVIESVSAQELWNHISSIREVVDAVEDPAAYLREVLSRAEIITDEKDIELNFAIEACEIETDDTKYYINK